MTRIIPDIYEKIGSVIKELRAVLGVGETFTTRNVYELYVKWFPGDLIMMNKRKERKPTSHGLEGHLNGMVHGYYTVADGTDPDMPAIEFLSPMTYRLK